MMTLVDKSILITGAARRLGRAVALTVARSGANVVIHHAHSADFALALAEEIRMFGRQAWIIESDLSNPENIKEMFARALAFTPLYGVINNAATFFPQTWRDTNLELWQNTFNLNLTAPFLLTQALAASLSSSQSGRVINMIDWRALRPGADHFAYTNSKAALVSLTRSYAQALAPRINVNAIALGAMLPPAGETPDPDLLSKIPLQRWGTLEELGRTILFLLDGPEEITGSIIHLDGGRHLI